MIKFALFSITLAVIVTAATGCTPAPKDPARNTSDQLEKINEHARVAEQDMYNYTYSERVEFSKGMQFNLDAINRDIAQMTVQISQSNADIQAESAPKIRDLKAKSASLQKQLDAMNGADESIWEELKSSIKKGYDDLKTGFNQARQWTSDKIAP